MNNERIRAVRGAVCTENTVDAIQSAVSELISRIFRVNTIAEQDIVSIQFSITRDLTVQNPAAALRKAGICTTVPLFCSAEPDISGSLPQTIRVLITWYSVNASTVPVYFNGAECLRPDLTFDNENL